MVINFRYASDDIVCMQKFSVDLAPLTPRSNHRPVFARWKNENVLFYIPIVMMIIDERQW